MPVFRVHSWQFDRRARLCPGRRIVSLAAAALLVVGSRDIARSQPSTSPSPGDRPQPAAQQQQPAEPEAKTIEFPASAVPYEPEKTPDLAQVEERIVEMTNQFRREHDREPLAHNTPLKKAAQAFADFMARTDRYGHYADGRKPAERVESQGYDACIVAENIAFQFNSRGFTTKELARGLVEGWQKSPPHRKNLLDPDVTEIGVALALSRKTGHFYAVQDFGRPKSAAVRFTVANRDGPAVTYTVNDRSFTLEPRMIRTHESCRAPSLKFQASEGAAPAEKVADQTFHPQSGTRYSIRPLDNGRYTVDVSQAD
jgi:uncharacterized protein YkwD